MNEQEFFDVLQKLSGEKHQDNLTPNNEGASTAGRNAGTEEPGAEVEENDFTVDPIVAKSLGQEQKLLRERFDLFPQASAADRALLRKQVGVPPRTETSAPLLKAATLREQVAALMESIER